MASGYGIKTSDWVLLAALGIGSYFVYKVAVKPVSEITESAGQLGSTIVNGLTDEIKDPMSYNPLYQIFKWEWNEAGVIYNDVRSWF